MTKPKKKFEYGLPKVGDQLYLEPKGERAMPRSGFYRLICCCGYYSLVSEDTWKVAYRTWQNTGFSTSYVNYNPNGSVKNIEFN